MRDLVDLSHQGFSQIIDRNGQVLQFETDQELEDHLNDQGDYWLE